MYLGFDKFLPAESPSVSSGYTRSGGANPCGPLLTWEHWDGANWLPVTVQDVKPPTWSCPAWCRCSGRGSNLCRPAKQCWPVARRCNSPMRNKPPSSNRAIPALTLPPAGQRGTGHCGDDEQNHDYIATSGQPTVPTCADQPGEFAPLWRGCVPGCAPAYRRTANPCGARSTGISDAVWAEQMRTFTNETLGLKNGQPNQIFFRQTPVLGEERVESAVTLAGPACWRLNTPCSNRRFTAWAG